MNLIIGLLVAWWTYRTLSKIVDDNTSDDKELYRLGLMFTWMFTIIAVFMWPLFLMFCVGILLYNVIENKTTNKFDTER